MSIVHLSFEWQDISGEAPWADVSTVDVYWQGIAAYKLIQPTTPAASDVGAGFLVSTVPQRIHVATSKLWMKAANTQFDIIVETPETIDIEVDARLDSLEAADVTTDARLAALEAITVPSGGGDTDDTEAIQAAIDAVIDSGVSGKVLLASGTFRITDELDCYRPASTGIEIIIEGNDQHDTVILCDFTGADKVALKSIDPAGLVRSGVLSIRNLQFANVSTSGGVNPCFVEIAGWGEGRMDHVRFGSSNNTVLRAGSPQNIYIDDMVSFYGGKHFNYKNTSGVTFNVTSGTIVASTGIFGAGDVDKTISIFPSDPADRAKYTISGYTNATTVSVLESTTNQTGCAGHFEPARCSISMGSTTLVANASCFAAEDVGRVIYIRACRDGAYGDALQRATIAGFTSATTVTLDVAADLAVVGEFFAVPTVDFYQPDAAGTLGAASSYVTIRGLQIEHYRGVGLVVQAASSWTIEGKIHGETAPTDAVASDAALWFDDYGGSYTGQFDSSCSTSDCRAYICNINELVSFPDLRSQNIKNEHLFNLAELTSDDGYVSIGTVGLTKFDTSLTDVFVDANTPSRILRFGVINMLEDSQPAFWQMGANASFSADSAFVYGASSHTDFPFIFSSATGVRMSFEDIATQRWSIGNTPGGGELFVIRNDTTAADILTLHATDVGATDETVASTVTWDGTPPATGTLKCSWKRLNGVVFYTIRLEYAVAGTTNSSCVIALPTGMPAPLLLTGIGASDVIAAATGFISASATSVPALSKAYFKRDGSGGYEFDLVLNSGTVSAVLAVVNGSYLTSV